VEVVALAKEALAASLDRLRVFGSTICVEMTILVFVDCGDHFEKLCECKVKFLGCHSEGWESQEKTRPLCAKL